jgi:hypothetical protein
MAERPEYLQAWDYAIAELKKLKRVSSDAHRPGALADEMIDLEFQTVAAKAMWNKIARAKRAEAAKATRDALLSRDRAAARGHLVVRLRQMVPSAGARILDTGLGAP